MGIGMPKSDDSPLDYEFYGYTEDPIPDRPHLFEFSVRGRAMWILWAIDGLPMVRDPQDSLAREVPLFEWLDIVGDPHGYELTQHLMDVRAQEFRYQEATMLMGAIAAAALYDYHADLIAQESDPYLVDHDPGTHE